MGRSSASRKQPAAAKETIANWKALEERNAAVRKVDAAAALVKALQQQRDDAFTELGRATARIQRMQRTMGTVMEQAVEAARAEEAALMQCESNIIITDYRAHAAAEAARIAALERANMGLMTQVKEAINDKRAAEERAAAAEAMRKQEAESYELKLAKLEGDKACLSIQASATQEQAETYAAAAAVAVQSLSEKEAQCSAILGQQAAQAEQAASSIGKAEARAAAATAALQQQAERSAAVQASLHADISALKAQLSTVRSEVQEEVAAANAACLQHKFAAAVAQRREAKLLDTAREFGKLYAFEIERLSKLYIHDMQAAGIVPSLPVYFKPAFPAWLCPAVMPALHRPLNPAAPDFVFTGIEQACAA